MHLSEGSSVSDFYKGKHVQMKGENSPSPLVFSHYLKVRKANHKPDSTAPGPSQGRECVGVAPLFHALASSVQVPTHYIACKRNSTWQRKVDFFLMETQVMTKFENIGIISKRTQTNSVRLSLSVSLSLLNVVMKPSGRRASLHCNS